MQQYFRWYNDYFWQWEDSGEVLAVQEGDTIAYREFVLELLEKLSDQGLPPFGSLLLAMIATNPEGARTLAVVEKRLLKQMPVINDGPDPLRPAIAFLQQLATLPAEYKQGRKRFLLFQTLFAGCHNHLSVANSKAVVKDFRTSSIMGGLLPAKTFPFSLYQREFTVIKLLAKRFPSNEAVLAKMAALPLVEEPVSLEERDHPDNAGKDFVETLVENTKTFHVGSLVKRLWSGLNIPHHNILPSQQPLGGVSDLSNKGEFHRLLLSEFASEDIVLLSRLANNEALYINREVPPRNNNRQRIILLDVSIKNWGTPKTLAFALLLAIARHPKTDILCQAFVVGTRCHPIRFETIDDIIESLQVLEPSRHPAEGLDHFFREYKEKGNAELFFVSSQETFRQALLHPVFSEQAAAFSYWILTDSEGGIDLYKRQHNSKKHVQHLQLPLEELWKRESGQAPERPAIKGLSFPLLFSGAMSPKKVVEASNGELFLITTEKALLRACNPRERNKKGWEMIFENLPISNGEAEIGLSEKGEYLLLLFKAGNKQLSLLNLTTGEQKTAFFEVWRHSQHKQFLYHQDRFFYRCQPHVKQHWTIQWNGGIQINAFENLPQELLEQYDVAEKKAQKLNAQTYASRDVLKNVTTVFINQLGNLVFNCHELRLTDREQVRLERSGFQKTAISARKSEQTFHFPDGSTVTVHRSGMLLLKSSDQSLETVYVPSVLDSPLGVATMSRFAGEEYYYRPGVSGLRTSPKLFWNQCVNPFIETIFSHGTQPEATR